MRKVGLDCIHLGIDYIMECGQNDSFGFISVCLLWDILVFMLVHSLKLMILFAEMHKLHLKSVSSRKKIDQNNDDSSCTAFLSNQMFSSVRMSLPLIHGCHVTKPLGYLKKWTLQYVLHKPVLLLLTINAVQSMWAERSVERARSGACKI